MPEIANCPLCGEAASIFRLDDDPVTFSHCGMQANSVELWNSYAAAMELEQLRSRYYHECDNMSKKEQKELLDMIYVANKRVLEVFK